jgi:hypothetical protein
MVPNGQEDLIQVDAANLMRPHQRWQHRPSKVQHDVVNAGCVVDASHLDEGLISFRREVRK